VVDFGDEVVDLGLVGEDEEGDEVAAGGEVGGGVEFGGEVGEVFVFEEVGEVWVVVGMDDEVAHVFDVAGGAGDVPAAPALFKGGAAGGEVVGDFEEWGAAGVGEGAADDEAGDAAGHQAVVALEAVGGLAVEAGFLGF